MSNFLPRSGSNSGLNSASSAMSSASPSSQLYGSPDFGAWRTVGAGNLPPAAAPLSVRSSPPLLPSQFPPVAPMPPTNDGFPTVQSRPGSHLRQPLPHPGFYEQMAGMSLGVSSIFTENIIGHPCIVMRRQSQVNYIARQYHTTPFTIFPVAYNLQNQQGFLSFWKGVTSSVVIQGLSYGLETMIGDLLGWPREITKDTPAHNVFRHIVLKGIVFTLTTPFAVSAFLDSVRSSRASDRPNPLDCIKGGFNRIVADCSGSRDVSRRIPLWLLVGPRVGYWLSHFLISSSAKYLAVAIIRKHMQRRMSQRHSILDDVFPELLATFAAHLTADAVLFPLETVLHRLYLQGTRTLIDNMDEGLEVMSVTSRYEGHFDCFSSIVRNEGIMGLYKGFGALVLQYAIHYAILRITRTVFEHLEEAMRERRQRAAATPPQLRAPEPRYAAYADFN